VEWCCPCREVDAHLVPDIQLAVWDLALEWDPEEVRVCVRVYVCACPTGEERRCARCPG
jgi:hypothetical protein